MADQTVPISQEFLGRVIRLAGLTPTQGNLSHLMELLRV